MSENVIAKIKDYEITEAEVNHFIETLPPEQKQYASNPRFRDQIVQQLVSVVLFSEYGKEEKLEETPLYAALLESAKRDILAQLAVEKVISGVTATEEEIQSYYNDNQNQFKKEESISAKHILVETEEKANEIKSEIESGEKTFEDAAKAFSSCPSKERGGDLGSFTRGQMVPEFDKASFEADLNKLVGPVKTQFGYHLIQVYSRSDADVAPLEEVADQIKARLTQKKQSEVYNEKVAELHARYAQ